MTEQPTADPATFRRNTPPHAPRPWPLPVTASPTIIRLAEQHSRSSPQQAEALLDRFWSDLTLRGTPLIEPAEDLSHRIVTFLYRGPAADRVYLQANKVTDSFSPAEGRLRPIPGTDIAALSLRMPADWICSYHFVVPPTPFDPGIRRSIREVLEHRDAVQTDPLNPRTMSYKLLPETGLSVLALDRAPRQPPMASTEHWHDARTAIRLPSSGRTVEIIVRSHPRAQACSPAVLLCDGEVWQGESGFADALEVRIAAGDCAPPHLVLLPSGGPLARQCDYPAGRDAQAELFDLARDALRAAVPGWHERWVVAAQSLGGLFSLLAAVRFPDRVVGAVAQSPSLWWPSGDRLDPAPGQWFAELGAAGTTAPCVVQAGRTEWILVDAVLHAREFLRGLDRLVETPHDLVTGGHDQAWWARTLPDAVLALLRTGGTAPGTASSTAPGPH